MKIGVTGHRRLVGSQLFEVAQKVKAFFLSKRDLELKILSGMALGFDQLVCEIIIELKKEHEDWNISYDAIVPCEEQEKLWRPAQVKNYLRLLEQAKEIVLVTPGPFEPWKMHVRNKHIVDQAEEMIVYWDGLFSGGTGNCMRYVNAKKLPFSNLYSKQ